MDYRGPGKLSRLPLAMITQKEYIQHAGLSKGQVSKLVAAGMPMTSVEEADRWRGLRARKPPPRGSDPADSRPQDASIPVDREKLASDSPEGAFERQRQIERAAYALAVKALRDREPDAPRLVDLHSRSVRNLTLARSDVLKLAQEERSLVSGEWVKRMVTEHDGVVAALVKSMPRQLASRIAPHDPEHAERELTRWVEETFLRSLHSIHPWKS
jgi:hypothetical protein